MYHYTNLSLLFLSCLLLLLLLVTIVVVVVFGDQSEVAVNIISYKSGGLI